MTANAVHARAGYFERDWQDATGSRFELRERLGSTPAKLLYGGMAVTDAALQARNWLHDRLADADIEHSMDGAGHLDGAPGVVCGLQALRVLSHKAAARSPRGGNRTN